MFLVCATFAKIPRRAGMQLFQFIQRYLQSLDSLVALGLINGAAAALISHKILIILFHSPVSIRGLVFLWPCLFEFDFITLILLHRGLSAKRRAYKWAAGVASLFIMLLSSGFAAFYVQANAEVEWKRAVEVLMDWQYLGGCMGRGYGPFVLIFLSYSIVAGVAILFRILLGQPPIRLCNLLSNDNHKFDKSQGQLRRRISPSPSRVVFLLLLFVTWHLPPYPWRHMTATLGYDIIVAAFMVMKSNDFYRQEADTDSVVDDDSFGGGYYSPYDDPFYISNLDQPIDDFIRRALKGTEFTNIVHIALESMREDSFPFQNDGLLSRHIHSSPRLKVVEPINTQTLTPFIASLAKHTLEWHTVWTSVPFTHKSMLGYFCGMLPIPRDWSVEAAPPSTWYQRCLPDAFRHLNLVTDTKPEIIALFNDSEPSTTDHWETIHLMSTTGDWDSDRQLLKSAGFDTVITAEDLGLFNGEKPFESAFGYFDEEGLDYLWKYIDHAQTRVPNNRLYISWMDSTTHWPFILPPEWKKTNYKTYYEDKSSDSSEEPGDTFELETVNEWLNTLKWTDDAVRDIILGFRDRGLEDETLFIIHGDHGSGFLGDWPTPVNNPLNELYRIPFMLYNPRIRNPKKQKIEGNFYSLSIPTTILDLMIHTNSLKQESQKDLASRFAANYESAQSLLRPVQETIRFFYLSPGGGEWTLDNGRNIRCRFDLTNDRVRMLNYIRDPLELETMESWEGVEGLIRDGAEERFGAGTADFLREAYRRQEYMKKEIFRRYGMEGL